MSNNIFFTSDTHYHHKNIVRGTTTWANDPTKGEAGVQRTRDFNTLEEHDEKLIENINKTVGQDDTLYHLGDWSFGGVNQIFIFRKRLNCKNIHLIFGNHDHHIENNVNNPLGFPRTQDLFLSTDYYKEVTIDKQRMILCHFTFRVWNKSHHNSFHLYGHSHSTLEDKEWGKSMDVGIDNAFRLLGEYRPFHLNEIEDTLNKRNTLIVDHHNETTN